MAGAGLRRVKYALAGLGLAIFVNAVLLTLPSFRTALFCTTQGPIWGGNSKHTFTCKGRIDGQANDSRCGDVIFEQSFSFDKMCSFDTTPVGLVAACVDVCNTKLNAGSNGVSVSVCSSHLNPDRNLLGGGGEAAATSNCWTGHSSSSSSSSSGGSGSGGGRGRGRHLQQDEDTNAEVTGTGAFINSGTTVTACDSTKYVHNNVCTACPSGSTCDGTNATACDSTKYVHNNVCTACPGGFTCNGTTATECDATRYVLANVCTTCPSDATCDGTSSLCNAGFTSSGATCTECAGNTYKTGTGNEACTSCPSDATCTTQSVQCNDATKYVHNNVCSLSEDLPAMARVLRPATRPSSR